MAGLNKVMLIGHLGRDPEIRYTQSGSAVASFSIATSETWNDKSSGERQERVEWHRIVVFGKQAEVCEKYLSKGSQIYIEGRLQTRSWEKDGQTHYTTEVVASSFQFLGGRPDGGQGGQNYNQNQGQRREQGGDQSRQQGGYNTRGHGQQGGPDQIPDDDIPF
jgi:single-strand DNA-binding protein